MEPQLPRQSVLGWKLEVRFTGSILLRALLCSVKGPKIIRGEAEKWREEWAPSVSRTVWVDAGWPFIDSSLLAPCPWLLLTLYLQHSSEKSQP